MEIDYHKFPLPNRLRHHTASNLYMPAKKFLELPDYYPQILDAVKWSEAFANSRPPEVLDIGCGRGALLMSWAELNPEMNIYGIEVRKPLVEWINLVTDVYHLDNCRALWYSVVNGLGFIEDSTISRVFYLFPDPWPKKKHLKRRAFNEYFVEEMSRVLKAGGKLYLASDIEEVHDYHKELMNANDHFHIAEINDDSLWDLPRTNKENFCRINDIKFYRLICTKE